MESQSSELAHQDEKLSADGNSLGNGKSELEYFIRETFNQFEIESIEVKFLYSTLHDDFKGLIRQMDARKLLTSSIEYFLNDKNVSYIGYVLSDPESHQKSSKVVLECSRQDELYAASIKVEHASMQGVKSSLDFAYKLKSN